MFFNDNPDTILARVIQPLSIKERPAKKNAKIFTKLVRPVHNHVNTPAYGKRELSLRLMYQNRQGYSLISVESIKDEQGNPLYVFLEESNQHYIETLAILRKKYRHYAGMQIGFNESNPEFFSALDAKPDLWWNLNANIIWSFDKKFMKNMKEYLNAYQEPEDINRLRPIAWFSETDFEIY
jgi:hypothetical protein